MDKFKRVKFFNKVLLQSLAVLFCLSVRFQRYLRMHNMEYGVEGSVAALLERWTCNPEDPSSSPTPTATYMWLRLKNRQLISLQPVGILNHVLFQLNCVSLSLKVMLYGTIRNNGF